jgi:hypothetical protein
MEQSPQQRTYGFQPGVSGNPNGRLSNRARAERIEAKARELAAEYGGFDTLSPVDRVLVTQAATLLLRRPKTHVDVVRVANSIARLLGGISKRRQRNPDRGPPMPSVAELMARARP